MYGTATLIVGSNPEKVRLKITEIMKNCGIETLKSPDVNEIAGEAKSIGIGDVKNLKDFLIKKPLVSKNKLLIVNNAEKLTLDAQNAMLKTLEEPTSTSHIVLITQHEDKLLPTVLSRCKKFVINEGFVPEEELLKLAEKFVKSETGDRLTIIEENKTKLTDRVEAVKFLDTVNFVLRQNLTMQNAKLASKILKVQSDIANTNVNVRLGLEYLSML
jgi:DNA polymerase-3 subunit delta'